MNRIKKVFEEKVSNKPSWQKNCNRRQTSLEVLFQIAEVLQMDVKDLIKSSNND